MEVFSMVSKKVLISTGRRCVTILNFQSELCLVFQNVEDVCTGIFFGSLFNSYIQSVQQKSPFRAFATII